MAFDDFYRGIPAPLAQEIDALSLLVYRCRTAAKALLEAEGVVELTEWYARFPQLEPALAHEGWERYLSAAVLTMQWEQARRQLAEKLRAAQGEMVEPTGAAILPLDAIAAYLAEADRDELGIVEWERMLDCLRCTLRNGTTLWVRYAAPDAYSFVWQTDSDVQGRIDTAPHAQGGGNPHCHGADGSVVADTLTSVSALPEANFVRVVNAVYSPE